MDIRLKAVFNKIGIENSDIDNLIEICPGLQFVDYKNATMCVKLVISSGYPEVDITSLIYQNPAFMLWEPKALSMKLATINGDIESALKANPFLI